LKREHVIVGMKVTPHSKSYCGNLDGSIEWKYAQSENQPYLFVSEICSHYIVLESTERSNKGDFFLPEDFEPYIENEVNANQENNNESRNVKMKKFDLNSSMLFKMRNGVLFALLNDLEGDFIFYDKIDIAEGYSGDGISLDDYNEELTPENDDWDIVAIKQRNGCVRVISDVLGDNEPEEWDWVEEVEKDEENVKESKTPIINNITINLTLDSNDDPAHFLKQLNDALEKIKKEGK